MSKAPLKIPGQLSRRKSPREDDAVDDKVASAVSAWAGARAVELELPKASRKGSQAAKPVHSKELVSPEELKGKTTTPRGLLSTSSSPQFSMSGFVAYRQLDPDMLQQVGQSVLQILQLESLQMAATNMVTILDDLIRMFGDESIALQFNIEEIERKISKAAKGQQNAQHSENSTSAKDSNIVHSSNDREGRSVAQQPTAGDLHSLESVTKPASGADSEDQSTSSSHPPEIPVIEIEHTHAGSDRSGPKSPRRHGAVTARSRLPSGGSKRISAHPRKKKPLDTAVETSCKRIAEVSDPQILSSLLIQLVKLHPELSRDVLLFLTGPITRNSVEFPRDDLSPSLHSKISFTVDLPKSDGSSEGTLDE